MKCYKCFFDFDNGAITEKLTSFVFLELEDKYLHVKDIEPFIKKALALKLFDSNDCIINNLKFISFKIYDGLVI